MTPKAAQDLIQRMAKVWPKADFAANAAEWSKSLSKSIYSQQEISAAVDAMEAKTGIRPNLGAVYAEASARRKRGQAIAVKDEPKAVAANDPKYVICSNIVTEYVVRHIRAKRAAWHKENPGNKWAPIEAPDDAEIGHVWNAAWALVNDYSIPTTQLLDMDFALSKIKGE